MPILYQPTVNFVISFIERNIKSPDWHSCEAAVMTFGLILDGPDAALLTLLVTQVLPILIEMIRDPNPQWVWGCWGGPQ